MSELLPSETEAKKADDELLCDKLLGWMRSASEPGRWHPYPHGDDGMQWIGACVPDFSGWRGSGLILDSLTRHRAQYCLTENRADWFVFSISAPASAKHSSGQHIRSLGSPHDAIREAAIAYTKERL